jgi:hypothetical protein
VTEQLSRPWNVLVYPNGGWNAEMGSA